MTYVAPSCAMLRKSEAGHAISDELDPGGSATLINMQAAEPANPRMVHVQITATLLDPDFDQRDDAVNTSHEILTIRWAAGKHLNTMFADLKSGAAFSVSAASLTVEAHSLSELGPGLRVGGSVAYGSLESKLTLTSDVFQLNPGARTPSLLVPPFAQDVTIVTANTAGSIAQLEFRRTPNQAVSPFATEPRAFTNFNTIPGARWVSALNTGALADSFTVVWRIHP